VGRATGRASGAPLGSSLASADAVSMADSPLAPNRGRPRAYCAGAAAAVERVKNRSKRAGTRAYKTNESRRKDVATACTARRSMVDVRDG
jgi:hypothetical protein